jgi:predicted phage-related endonuclease
MAKATTLQEVIELTRQLSLLDKVRLIKELAPQIERELTTIQPTQRTTLRGLWEGLDIIEEDIAEVRTEMWSNFPRKDV